MYKEYIKRFRNIYTYKDIKRYIDGIKDKRVLVIGEAIIDDYQFGKSLGKAGKEPIIAFNVTNEEKYLGGALAVANHVSNFTNNVDLIAMLGDKRTQRTFIRHNLNNTIEPMFIYKKDSPTISKKRFIDIESGEKVFELYDFKDSQLNNEQSNNLIDVLEQLINKYDIVIVCDFGHGFITEEIRNVLYESSFLSVNTQNNAGNQGMNTINKYHYPSYICIDEKEIRLAAGDRYGNLEEIIKDMFLINVCNVNITKGEKGSITYDCTTEEFFYTPAFAENIVDKIGAGDAVLSITSLVANECPAEIIGFIGNCVGALAVRYSGNKESIKKKELLKFIEEILK